MKKLLTTAAVLVALIAPTSARDYSEIPTSYLGTWCFVSKDEYGTEWKRGQCPVEERLTVYPHRCEAAELGCRWKRGSVNRLGKFLATAKCEGDGHPILPISASRR
jgi:hypothetical protein